MNCSQPIGSYVPVHRKPKQRAYLRRESARAQKIKQSAYTTQLQGTDKPFALGGIIIALGCLLGGSTLLFLAAKDYLYYAPVRSCAISFLEAVANREISASGMSGQYSIEIQVQEIKLAGDRAVVNAGLAVPGNWINTKLYAARNRKGDWEIVGVTHIDAHVENKQNLELAEEIETAFRSIPDVQIKRY